MKAGDVGAETAAAQIYLGVTFTALGFALIAFFHRYADRDLMHWHSVSYAQCPCCILGVNRAASHLFNRHDGHKPLAHV